MWRGIARNLKTPAAQVVRSTVMAETVADQVSDQTVQLPENVDTWINGRAESRQKRQAMETRRLQDRAARIPTPAEAAKNLVLNPPTDTANAYRKAQEQRASTWGGIFDVFLNWLDKRRGEEQENTKGSLLAELNVRRINELIRQTKALTPLKATQKWEGQRLDYLKTIVNEVTFSDKAKGVRGNTTTDQLLTMFGGVADKETVSLNDPSLAGMAEKDAIEVKKNTIAQALGALTRSPDAEIVSKAYETVSAEVARLKETNPEVVATVRDDTNKILQRLKAEVKEKGLNPTLSKQLLYLKRLYVEAGGKLNKTEQMLGLEDNAKKLVQLQNQLKALRGADKDKLLKQRASIEAKINAVFQSMQMPGKQGVISALNKGIAELTEQIAKDKAGPSKEANPMDVEALAKMTAHRDDLLKKRVESASEKRVDVGNTVMGAKEKELLDRIAEKKSKGRTANLEERLLRKLRKDLFEGRTKTGAIASPVIPEHSQIIGGDRERVEKQRQEYEARRLAAYKQKLDEQIASYAPGYPSPQMRQRLSKEAQGQVDQELDLPKSIFQLQRLR
jgi:chorismate mutase